jgi:hypothetical protein
VNDSKTELCLFHRNSQPRVTVMVSGSPVVSKSSMNVLGVIFDCNLNWKEQVTSTIKKSNKMLHAIRMIKCFFNPRKLKIFLNANYYSVLFYNSEIWLTSHLNSGPKQQLLSASAKAICSCTNFTNRYISFEKVHTDFN